MDSNPQSNMTTKALSARTHPGIGVFALQADFVSLWFN